MATGAIASSTSSTCWSHFSWPCRSAGTAREERGAGLCTFPLVAMASCGFVQTAISVLGPGATTQANIMQGVIIGVGFIGAGAIKRQVESTTGNATAASIWTVGIIGAAVGYGYFDIGLILAVANLAVLKVRAQFLTDSARPPDTPNDKQP